MSNPFTGYNSNQRIVAIPISPQAVEAAAVANVTFNSGIRLALSTVNIATQSCCFYLHYARLTLTPSALAQLHINIQVQFLNAALAVVSGPTTIGMLVASINNATGTNFSDTIAPPIPVGVNFTGLDATAVWANVRYVAVGFTGAPQGNLMAMYGIDQVNTGLTGEIGGAGMVAASAFSPNTF